MESLEGSESSVLGLLYSEKPGIDDEPAKKQIEEMFSYFYAKFGEMFFDAVGEHGDDRFIEIR